MSKVKTTEHLICFFDILGYKNILNNTIKFHEPQLIIDIKEIVKDIYKIKKIFDKAYNKIKIYTFSDNFLIAIEINNNSNYFIEFNDMITIIQEIQFKIVMYHGFFIRGSLVKGQLYTGRNFVYGRGLIKAYELENKEAKYPRIIVDNDSLSEIYNNFKNEDDINEMFAIIGEKIVGKSFNSKDISDKDYKLLNILKNSKLKKEHDDKLYFIDFLHGIEVFRYKFGYNDTLNYAIAFLDLYTIRVLVNLLINSKESEITKKYFWCCAHYNIFCKENNYDCLIDIDKLMQNYNNPDYIYRTIYKTKTVKEDYENKNNSDILIKSIMDRIGLEIGKVFSYILKN